MKVLSDLISAVKARQQEITESLVSGQPANFEAYQLLVGRFHGLQESLDVLNQLLEEKNE
jgi:hypothetical protein